MKYVPMCVALVGSLMAGCGGEEGADSSDVAAGSIAQGPLTKRGSNTTAIVRCSTSKWAGYALLGAIDGSKGVQLVSESGDRPNDGQGAFTRERKNVLSFIEYNVTQQSFAASGVGRVSASFASSQNGSKATFEVKQGSYGLETSLTGAGDAYAAARKRFDEVLADAEGNAVSCAPSGVGTSTILYGNIDKWRTLRLIQTNELKTGAPTSLELQFEERSKDEQGPYTESTRTLLHFPADIAKEGRSGSTLQFRAKAEGQAGQSLDVVLTFRKNERGAYILGVAGSGSVFEDLRKELSTQGDSRGVHVFEKDDAIANLSQLQWGP